MRAGRHSFLGAGIRVAALTVLIGIAVATPGVTSAPSLLAMLTTVSFVGCVAVGMTLITLSGNIMAFCLGATAAASAVVFVHVMNLAGFGVAVPAALAFGALLTALQGFFIGWLRANPIIVSIAALALILGAAQALTAGQTAYVDASAAYEWLRFSVLGVPSEFLVFLIVLILGQFMLSFTRFGRHLYMVGASRRAAEAAGVRVWRTVAGAYLWAGLFSAVSGVMLAMRYNSASMEYAVNYDYDAIAAVLVGGTAIGGGQGSALRTLAGVLVIGLVQMLLLLNGLRQEWQLLITGLIVLGMIMLHTASRR
jgi:ribose/xylose/arabinose/galactoside ABC-type transport system permease subunit